MELSKKQQEGLKIILDRYKQHCKYTVISGYAGSGKTTLVSFAISALDVKEEDVAYATFTGKAAEVLRKKGNQGAITLHRLLYTHAPKPDGTFYRKKKEHLDYKIVVVDEVSMVPKSMIDLLLTHPVYVLFLGDPFQLPQISKDDTHDLLDHPHVFLDEIMRQAKESEIIQLTMKIRNGESIPYMKGKEVIVIPKNELVTGHLTWADQIIVGTNATRMSINNQMRALYGYTGSPQEGEKLICLRNYWDDFSTEGNSLVNGTTGILKNCYSTFRNTPPILKLPYKRLDIVCGDFITSDNDKFSCVEMDKKMIMTGEKCIDWKSNYKLEKNKKRFGDIVPREFAYGYAITCHKSQGSEWDKVLVLEERFPYEKEEHARWLYTACTRSAEKLVLVRG